jgi:hypothetical protein
VILLVFAESRQLNAYLCPRCDDYEEHYNITRYLLQEEVRDGMHRERDREIRRRRKRREKRLKARIKELKAQAKKA